MSREAIIQMATEAGIEPSVGRTLNGKYHPNVNALGKSVPVEWLERFANIATKDVRREYEGMAECMDMVHHDLILAGIIDKSVPPMMIPEAVIGAIRAAVAAEREACAKVCNEMRNLQSVTEHSDQSVLVTFTSCRAAQAFRAAIAQAKESKT